jgi:ABC-type polysaccharide/polyol phosphate transport system ATPase subunit
MSAIVLEHASVEFPIYGSHRSLRKALFERATGGLVRQSSDHPNSLIINALDDVSLELRDGDRVGLVGHNGAGKSTLLKVMAGVYEPITGRILAEGRITPLFERMPGLDVEDSGYENIMTSGMLLGLKSSDIEKIIPGIEEFSELGEYLSLPVRSYSAGMVTRLGFALATAIEPGILLMDEGLSTGDARFSERAAQRMSEFVGRSRILVLASHSEDLIRSSCNKAALMKSGRIITFGTVDDVLAMYHDILAQDRVHHR